jgi:hypothetical protein
MFAVIVDIIGKSVVIYNVLGLSIQDFMNKRCVPFERKYDDKYSIWEGEDEFVFGITKLNSYTLSKEEAKYVHDTLSKRFS